MCRWWRQSRHHSEVCNQQLQNHTTFSNLILRSILVFYYVFHWTVILLICYIKIHLKKHFNNLKSNYTDFLPHLPGLSSVWMSTEVTERFRNVSHFHCLKDVKEKHNYIHCEYWQHANIIMQATVEERLRQEKNTPLSWGVHDNTEKNTAEIKFILEVFQLLCCSNILFTYIKVGSLLSEQRGKWHLKLRVLNIDTETEAQPVSGFDKWYCGCKMIISAYPLLRVWGFHFLPSP